MSKLKGLIAVAVISLAGTSFNVSATGTLRCPELPAHSGTQWVSVSQITYPGTPSPFQCAAEDAKSGKLLFTLYFGKEPYMYYPQQSHGIGTGIVAGRRVRWFKWGSADAVGTAFPWLRLRAIVPLDNGVLMQVGIPATSAAEKHKALDVLAHLRLPNQG